MAETTEQINFGPALAVAFHQNFEELSSGWLSFDHNYLLYASRGVFHLEIGERQWSLPPQRAAWIAAHVPFRVTCRQATSASVVFAEGAFDIPDPVCCVFGLSALAREMIQFAMRWGRDRDPADAVADRFFLSLATVCLELASRRDPFWLPIPSSPELTRAMAFVDQRLDSDLSMAEAAQAASVSERTLARRFETEVGMSWQHYLRRVRMLRAMDMLSVDGPRIIEVANSVGFQSQSAFISAFREFTGDTPSAYRARFSSSAVPNPKEPLI